MNNSFRVISCCMAFLLALPAAIAEPAKDAARTAQEELRFVVVISRHGVRSPTGDVSRLNAYSHQPWPEWSVPPGYLTAHGFALMKQVGGFDRQYYAAQGLFTENGCSDAAHIRILADSDQRTRETARAMAEGLAPGCALSFRALAEGEPDPVFHPLSANVGHFDKEMAFAAMAGRIGDNPQALIEAYRPQLKALDEVLNSCPSGAACPASQAPPQSVFTAGKSERSAEPRSSLGPASSMAESLLLEYCEGMDAERVGWGRVNLQKLRELLQLHTAAEDVAQRTSYIARAKSSNMLFHVLRSIQQARSGRALPGALTKPDDRLLVLVGHDTNLANIAGALGLNWLVDGRRDDTPPGGALVFELWRNRKNSQYKVRAYFSAQTLDQMRNAVPLSLAAPLERVPVYMPGCSGGDGACELHAFERTLQSAINPDFVK